MLIDDLLHSLGLFLHDTPMGALLRSTWVVWATFESLHFLGMSLLLGTVGMFDLRLLGFARGISFAALHRLIPLGICGFALNAMTGFCFLCATPDQYLFNAAFRWKLAFILTAGFNIMFFYGRVFRRLKTLGPTATPPLGARVVGAVSLCAWIGVMSAGRLLTFYRP